MGAPTYGSKYIIKELSPEEHSEKELSGKGLPGSFLE